MALDQGTTSSRAILFDAAGAIVGSALVEVLERGEDAAGYLKSLQGS